MTNKTLGMPYYRVFPHGRGRSLRYEVWNCVDLGDGTPLKLSLEDRFDNHAQASERAKLDNEEEVRSRASKPSPI